MLDSTVFFELAAVNEGSEELLVGGPAFDGEREVDVLRRALGCEPVCVCQKHITRHRADQQRRPA